MATTIYPAPTPAGNNNIGDVDVLTVPAVPAGSNNIGHVDGQGTAGSPSGGVVSVQGVASGTAQPASQSGTWTVQPGNTANTTAWLVSQRPATSGGLTIHRKLAAATTNSTNVKGSAGQVFGFTVHNLTASVKFLKFYNKATAPTVGTDTPVLTVPVPANGVVVYDTTIGIAFATGIGYGLTGALADADTTALAANDMVLNLFYA